MDIGVTARASSESVDPAELAKRAEELGFESFWLPEHPILPVHTTSRYGGTPDGSIPASMADIGDPLIALAMAAAATSAIKLGTSISLVPEHNPLMQAKQIATLDKFSGGRGSCSALARAGCGKRPRSWAAILNTAGGRPGKRSWR